MFQSTRPRGARPASKLPVKSPGVSFNPRARVGRDLAEQARAEVRSLFQSTRPRGARHPPEHGRARAAGVSIHAPAWGATHKLLLPGRSPGVSIHAPAWGATLITALRRFSGDGFNPRARVGRDKKLLDSGLIPLDVSIHAPAWGATRDAAQVCPSIVRFQSTRPRGARRVANAASRIKLHVSIHAPAWGATLLGKLLSRRRRCFNPRARVGRDLVSTLPVPRSTMFQSTRPRGARPARIAASEAAIAFQSTRPRGARH